MPASSVGLFFISLLYANLLFSLLLFYMAGIREFCVMYDSFWPKWTIWVESGNLAI
jgi:hypothetical protein